MDASPSRGDSSTSSRTCDREVPWWGRHHAVLKNTFFNVDPPLAERPEAWVLERGHHSDPLPSSSCSVSGNESGTTSSTLDKLDHILFGSEYEESSKETSRKNIAVSSANVPGHVNAEDASTADAGEGTGRAGTGKRPSKEKRERYRLMVDRLEHLIEDQPETDIRSIALPESVVGNDWLKKKLIQRLEKYQAAVRQKGCSRAAASNSHTWPRAAGHGGGHQAHSKMSL
uniref:Uncharacterized protein n=1 Tax=Pyrodinium bahamense TaxID=73915 RepID=A0A7S0A312_9DINO